MMRLRLLISPFNFEKGTTCPNEKCNARPFDEYPSHAFDCKATAHFRTGKHDKIRNLLFFAAKKLIPTAVVRKEITYTRNNVTRRVDVDITLSTGQKVIIDVCVINQSNPSNANGASLLVDGAARKAEITKTRKYEKCGDLIQEYYFIPFIVETTGRLGPVAFDFIKALTLDLKVEKFILTSQIRCSLMLNQSRQVLAARSYITSGRKVPGSENNQEEVLEEEEEISSSDVNRFDALRNQRPPLVDLLRGISTHGVARNSVIASGNNITSTAIAGSTTTNSLHPNRACGAQNGTTCSSRSCITCCGGGAPSLMVVGSGETNRGGSKRPTSDESGVSPDKRQRQIIEIGEDSDDDKSYYSGSEEDHLYSNWHKDLRSDLE
jgi:hypothetical protein